MILTNGINLRVSPTGRLMGSGAATNLYWMFTNSEVGGYIDLAPIYPHQSLYQDVAGTTPVTEPGQTVALARVKPYGIDFTQASASLRPTYAVRPKGGRRNLLTYTEEFDNATWSKVDATIAANSVIAPDGTLTADKLAAGATTGYHRVEHAASFIASGNYSASIIVKAAELAFVSLTINSGTGFTPNPKRAYFNLSTGTVSIAINGAIASIEDLGGGWYRCSVSAVANATGGSGVIQVGVHNASGDVLTFLGDGVSGIYVWGAQLETGAAATPYQRVTSMFDVYEAGKTHYGALWFDGVDDFMVSGTVTPGTDKVQVFAGVRKNSDAAVSVLIEHSASHVDNVGSFALRTPDVAGSSTIGFVSKGTVQSGTAIAGINVNTSNVIVARAEIATDTNSLRINAAADVTSATDQGTGNYLAYPIYLGRRGGTTLPFNGEIEALIGYRFGPNLSDTQLTQIATFINSRTGAY